MDKHLSTKQKQQERFEKQNYLKAQIIDQGYNHYRFADFLEKQKENGFEIDSWSIDELQEQVNEFKEIESLNKPKQVDISYSLLDPDRTDADLLKLDDFVKVDFFSSRNILGNSDIEESLTYDEINLIE